MTWTKLPQELLDDVRLLDLDRSDRWLHVEALMFANRTLSDGVIDRRFLARFTDHDDPKAAAARLVAAGLWEELSVGWLIVDFAEDQLSRKQVEALRKASYERQKRSRAHRSGDHALCRPSYCPNAPMGEPSRRDIQRESRSTVPDRTGPTGKVREGRGEPGSGVTARPVPPKKSPAAALLEAYPGASYSNEGHGEWLATAYPFGGFGLMEWSTDSGLSAMWDRLDLDTGADVPDELRDQHQGLADRVARFARAQGLAVDPDPVPALGPWGVRLVGWDRLALEDALWTSEQLRGLYRDAWRDLRDHWHVHRPEPSAVAQ